jgi:hypothetical protein
MPTFQDMSQAVTCRHHKKIKAACAPLLEAFNLSHFGFPIPLFVILLSVTFVAHEFVSFGLVSREVKPMALYYQVIFKLGSWVKSLLPQPFGRFRQPALERLCNTPNSGMLCIHI